MSLVPHGFCQCGCGEKARVAPVNDASKGWVKGEPLKYLKGHGFRGGKSGPDAPNWKGGKQKCSQGYVMLWTPAGRQYEHIIVAEKALGRPLKNFGRGNPKSEVVHHINGVKNDNRPQNLLICTHEYHTALHHRLEASADWPEFKKVIRNQGVRHD